MITSKQNPKIKETAKLKIKKYRDSSKKFLVEGYYSIKFALQNNYPLEELFFCKGFFREKFNNQEVINICQRKGVTVTELPGQVFEKLSSLESPEGLIAVAPQRMKNLSSFSPIENGIYVIIESIEKLGNLGAIFRLADNAGVTGVIVCDMRADIYNPETIRSSVGTFFSINILQASSQEAIDWCKRNKIKTLATSPQATCLYTDLDLTGSIAIVMGTEYAGLTDLWLKNADEKILIPMFGQANSLSVTASTAVVLYESVRQRHI
ncbi:MAG TPA: RNA methyltransferase [bacterium]|nr:RNA methyltransferase [bacterium]